jgi:hypothetical protein
MRKVLPISVVTALVLIAVVIVVQAQAPGPGTWNVGFTMQNLNDSEEANVHIDFIQADGSDGGTWDGTIEPGDSKFLYSGNISGLAGETAATISSDQQLAVVANMASDSPKTEAAYSGVDEAETASELFAPGVYKDYYNNVSNIRVQNTGSYTTCVEVTFYALGETTATDIDVYDVAPGAGHTFTQEDNPDLPRRFIGSATIESVDSGTSGCGSDTTADQPLAAIVNISITPGPSAGNPTDMYLFGSYNAVTGGDSVAYAPVLANNYYDNISALTVLNLRSTAQWVRVTYGDGSESEKQLAADASELWYTPNEGPAERWFGGAKVECITAAGGSVTTDCEIVATVNQINTGERRDSPGFAAYNGFVGGSTSARLPIVNRRYATKYGGYTTSVTCQNISDVTTDVSLGLTGGNSVPDEEDVPPNGTAFWYLNNEDYDDVAVGFNGSATATALASGAEVVCIGQQNGETPPTEGDWLTTYNGIGE